MQNEYNYGNTNMMDTSEEIVVDIRDALYSLLRRWPALLVGLLCGALFLGVFSIWRGRNAASGEQAVAIEDRVEAARGELGNARASEIEGMYTQYQEYTMLQNLLRDQYVEFMRDIERVDQSYVKTLKFLCSGEDAGPTGIFEPQTVLGEEECREIGKIIAEENDTKKATILTRNRVIFQVDNNNKLAVSAEEILPVRYILTVRIIGEYKGQCDLIQTVVERKMMKLQQAYTDAGGVLEMTLFASEYTNDVATAMKDTVNTLSGQLRSVTDNIYYFQTNIIDKLDDSAKAYYELLKEQGQAAPEAGKQEVAEEEQPVTSQPHSWMSYLSKKYVLIGALAGVFLSALCILMHYIMTHAIQSKECFDSLYGIPHRDSVYKKNDSHASSLRMKLYRLFHMADELTPAKSAAMAQDMAIELEKTGRKSLYILLSEASDGLNSLAQTLISDMHTQNPEVSVRVGDPLNDPEQMTVLAESESAMLLVGLKKTKREAAAQQLQMCSRYQVPVIGAVTLEVV